VSDGIADRQVVGIDLHLHRSVIARIDGQGNELGWVRIDNDPRALVAECRKAGRGVPVAIEATYQRVRALPRRGRWRACPLYAQGGCWP